MSFLVLHSELLVWSQRSRQLLHSSFILHTNTSDIYIITRPPSVCLQSELTKTLERNRTVIYSSQSTSLLSDTVYQALQVPMLFASVQTDLLALLKPIVFKCAIPQRTIQNKDFFFFFYSSILTCRPYFIFKSSSCTLACFRLK